MDISGVRVLDRFILLDGRYAELIEAWKIKVRQVSSLENINLEGVTVNISGDSVTFLIKDTMNNATLKIVCDVFEAPVEVSVESVSLQLSEK